MLNTFDHIRDTLQSMGFPGSDYETFVPSRKRFDDGANYRLEIPTMNSAKALEALLDESTKLGLTINRVTETIGICRHNKMEIKHYVELCQQYGCQLLMSPGPRAVYDTGGSAKSPQGNFVAYRLRGQDQLVYAISDILRAIDLGVSGFVIYDEGLLQILGEWKREGKIPSHILLKVSAHCGHGNPASIRLLEQLGANSINPIRDLSLSSLQAIRQCISVPMDCHVDSPVSSGGFIRFYDAPRLVEALSPVYIKTGNSLLPSHGSVLTCEQARAIAHQSYAVSEIIQEHAPSAVQSDLFSTNYCI
ncbi:U32 family peptidase [Paenibacillus polysaccharolyticus]|uniref:U32 family peptidase n=1 Tax=Paenibacillus polysaccharolyticus TaxID=582692 RepID=UPI00203B86FE|nr:U32 family peptidase [Paenibacillus polysaccharolyticus]MCM3132895.1 U32 family peptidase [Paenibacillus polysaccharolyticus]